MNRGWANEGDEATGMGGVGGAGVWDERAGARAGFGSGEQCGGGDGVFFTAGGGEYESLFVPRAVEIE